MENTPNTPLDPFVYNNSFYPTDLAASQYYYQSGGSSNDAEQIQQIILTYAELKGVEPQEIVEVLKSLSEEEASEQLRLMVEEIEDVEYQRQIEEARNAAKEQEAAYNVEEEAGTQFDYDPEEFIARQEMILQNQQQEANNDIIEEEEKEPTEAESYLSDGYKYGGAKKKFISKLKKAMSGMDVVKMPQADFNKNNYGENMLGSFVQGVQNNSKKALIKEAAENVEKTISQNPEMLLAPMAQFGMQMYNPMSTLSDNANASMDYINSRMPSNEAIMDTFGKGYNAFVNDTGIGINMKRGGSLPTAQGGRQYARKLFFPQQNQGNLVPENMYSTEKVSTPDDYDRIYDIVGNTLDRETRLGYSNYGFTQPGATQYANTKEGRDQAINAAIDQYFNKYGLYEMPDSQQAMAFDFAFNSEDPRASMMVAAGKLTPAQKLQMYSQGKLDPAKVDEAWKKYGADVMAMGDALNDPFAAEKIRSYRNTTGANTNLPEWTNRVNEVSNFARNYFSKNSNQSSSLPSSNTPMGNNQRSVNMFNYVPGLGQNPWGYRSFNNPYLQQYAYRPRWYAQKPGSNKKINIRNLSDWSNADLVKTEQMTNRRGKIKGYRYKLQRPDVQMQPLPDSDYVAPIVEDVMLNTNPSQVVQQKGGQLYLYRDGGLPKFQGPEASELTGLKPRSYGDPFNPLGNESNTITYKDVYPDETIDIVQTTRPNFLQGVARAMPYMNFANNIYDRISAEIQRNKLRKQATSIEGIVSPISDYKGRFSEYGAYQPNLQGFQGVGSAKFGGNISDGEYYLSDSEIQDIINMGGEVEFLED